MHNNIGILSMHIKILTYLLLWPRTSLSTTANKCLIYGYFCLSTSFFTPVIWAVLYQLYVKIYDVNILLEALIAVCDIIGYMVAYVCFLKNKVVIENIIKDINNFLQFCHPRLYVKIYDVNILLEALIAVFDIIGYMVAYVCFLKNKVVIENIIKDINNFLQFCHPRVIQDTDIVCSRYTKYMLIYVSVGVAFNLSWPMMSRKYCIAEKGSDFYLRHDPCGMPTHNFYPFDASQPHIFWIVFFVEGIYVCHICYVFSIVTATILGLLMHITAQLKHCGFKFENISFKRDQNNSTNDIKQNFIICVKYHQDILAYAKRTFAVFNAVVSAYVTITSFATAVIGYQIVEADNIQDRLRYTMLLFAWGLLFFMVCFHAQKVQDESVALANSVYNSEWNTNSINSDLRRNINIVVARAQHPVYFNLPYLGTISLSRFVIVMKTAYSFFTILLTVAHKD